MKDSPQALAERLQAAWETRRPIEPLSSGEPDLTLSDAYAVQRAWAGLREAAGERTVGRKIGLTSPAMQGQMGVGEPDFGDLWGSRRLGPDGGTGEAELDAFVQPKVEGEIAFLMEAPLVGPGVEEADVLAAAGAAAPAIEVVDSRIADWRIKLVDTVADNASYGGFLLGAWSEDLLARDLREVRLEVRDGAEVVSSELGTAVLGSPLRAVAWLANRLGEFGIGIAAGDVVLSGSFGPALSTRAGQRIAVEVADEPPVELRFH